MISNFIYAGKAYTVKLEKDGDSYRVEIGKNKYVLGDRRVMANTVTMDLNGVRCTVYFANDKSKIYVAVGGEFYQFETDKNQEQKTKGTVGAKGNNVVSQMPGLLVKVPVSIGDKVAAGTTLAVVEAMKMQNELRSPSDGIVKKINFKEGQQIDAFVPIVELEV